MRYKLMLCLIIIQLTAQGQEGRLEGVVTSSDGTPLELATAELQGADYFAGAITDEFGAFTIEAIPVGSYTLLVSSLNYSRFSTRVEIRSNSTSTQTIQLEKDRLDLDEVVVSATRYEMGLQETPVLVQTTGKRLFEATQSMTVSEVLNFQPGVRVETNCQNCGFTQVRLNGLEGAYSQILINSRAVFSALNSVYGLEQIPTSIIERVEVVRGGGSALYGSNAIAGTVNIITKEPVINTWEVSSNFALIDGGSPDNTINFNASLVDDDLRSGVTFFGMFRDREAWDANGDSFTEITGLENNTFGTKAFFKSGKRNKITLDFSTIREYRRGGDRLELPPHFTDITEELDHNTIIGGLTFEQKSKDQKGGWTAYASGQTTQRDSYYGGLGGGREPADTALALNAYGNTQDLALIGGLQYAHQWDSGDALVAGIENQLSDVQDDIPGYNRLIDQRVNNIGLFGQYEWQVSQRFKALLGARYDHTSVDGFYRTGTVERSAGANIGVVSPRATFLFDLNDRVQIRAGYARGFRAPQAFNEDLHISSVGGEPQFVIISEDLEKELSDAFSASISYTQTIFGQTQTSALLEGFYTKLHDPFTLVSTGATLPNGSIVEEVRNGAGAYVAGLNFEFNASPSREFLFQVGGTVQQAIYDEAQFLFEPEEGNESEPTVSVEEFVRTPNLYGFLTTNWSPSEAFQLDVSGVYTGSMIVPRVVSESGFLELINSNAFFELNLKGAYHFHLQDQLHLELNGGIQNLFNSFQDDFDIGPGRDSNYIYGPARPRTFFIGLKLGNFHG